MSAFFLFSRLFFVYLHDHGFNKNTLKMGEAIRRSGVSGFAWGTMVTVFISLMTVVITNATGKQKMRDDILINKNRTEVLDQRKATEERVDGMEKENDRTYNAIIRVEDMLKEHMKHD